MMIIRVHDKLEEQILAFIKNKDTDIHALRHRLDTVLDAAYIAGDIGCSMFSTLKIKDEQLIVTIRPHTSEIGMVYDMNGEYEHHGPDQEPWPEDALTYPPVPMEEYDSIFKEAHKRFEEKLQPGMCIVPQNGETVEDARQRRMDEIGRFEDELVAEVNAQLPFEVESTWMGYFPKNPYKEIDGCIVVRK